MSLAKTREWQEVVLTFDKIAGGEHGGGANDGKLHGPVTSFHLCVSKTTFGGAPTGEVWIDDVEAVLDVDDR